MQVIRSIPHGKYNCDQIIEIFSPEWCSRAGWTATENYIPLDGESVHILDDNAEAEVGWRIRNGIPIPDDEIVLEDIKADKLNELSDAYDNYETTASVETSLGYPIQIGRDHILKLGSALRYADAMGSENIYITDANNISHEDVPIKDAKKALKEAMGAAMAAHHHKQKLREAIIASKTVKELKTIKWDK